MASVTFESASKTYPDGTSAVTALDLRVPDGEFMVLVGPSGCGKTTALRMVAGLEEISDGAVRIGERIVNDVPPRDRDIAMVFQNYALYPHLSVFDNMAFALKLRRVAGSEIDRRVTDTARTIDLHSLLGRKPAALSGGQRQRVAMGRAVVRQPQVFLMDEPLSNLDAKLRVQMRAEIARLQRDLAVTTVYVTHDQVEAMTMADRVAVMRKGTLQQVATPREVYDRPVNVFVAGFIGSPAMNLLEATLVCDNGGYSLRTGSQALALDPATLTTRPRLRSFEGKRLIVGIRPEHLEDAALATTPPQHRLHGTVELVEALGSEIIAHVAIDAIPARTDEVRELAQDVGDDRALHEIELPAQPSGATVVGRFVARSRVRAGDAVEVAVDTSALHFFDPTTGLAIFDT